MTSTADMPVMNNITSNQGQRSCQICNATSTSQWRYGGAELLCNACGIRYRRRNSKRRIRSSIAKPATTNKTTIDPNSFRRFRFLPLPPLALLAATAVASTCATTNSNMTSSVDHVWCSTTKINRVDTQKKVANRGQGMSSPLAIGFLLNEESSTNSSSTTRAIW